MGQILLTKNDNNGIELIKKSGDLDSELVISCMDSIIQYSMNDGLEDKVDEAYEWFNKKLYED